MANQFSIVKFFDENINIERNIATQDIVRVDKMSNIVVVTMVTHDIVVFPVKWLIAFYPDMTGFE